jgi:hypothetical protein
MHESGFVDPCRSCHPVFPLFNLDVGFQPITARQVHDLYCILNAFDLWLRTTLFLFANLIYATFQPSFTLWDCESVDDDNGAAVALHESSPTSVMDQSVQRLLTDKLYDKRKQGALE